MRRRICTVLLLLAVFCVAAGCAGKAARDHVLMPAAESAWDGGVLDDVVRGINDAAEDGDITEMEATSLMISATALSDAFDSGDRDALLLVDWATLRPYADRGVQDRVDDGEVSPGVAESLTERVVNFDEAMARLAEHL